jgi:hypothetical protein
LNFLNYSGVKKIKNSWVQNIKYVDKNKFMVQLKPLKRVSSPLIFFFNDKYNIIFEKNIREFIIQMNIRSTLKQIPIVYLNKRQKQNKIRREKKKKNY